MATSLSASRETTELASYLRIEERELRRAG